MTAISPQHDSRNAGSATLHGGVRRIDLIRARMAEHFFLSFAAALAAVLISGMLPRIADAHAGDLDPTFGNNGVVIVPNLRLEAPFDAATALAVQPDGKIVVVGQWGAVAPGPTFAIARFDPDGTPDSAFGFEGLVTLSSGFAGGDEAHAVAIMPDGDIMVGGHFGANAGVYRLKPDGQLDTTFGSAGAVVVELGGGTHSMINSLAIDGSGGTYFAGTQTQSGPARYVLGWLAADGSIIAASTVSLGFGDLDQIATSLVRQPDGDLVVAGYADLTDKPGYGAVYCAVARFQPTVLPAFGFAPDPGYGNGPTEFFRLGAGPQTTGCYIDALTLLPDASVLAGGREPLATGGWTGIYARLDAAGHIDSSFIDVRQFTPWGDNSVRRIVVQSDGRPVLVGFTGVDATGVPGPFAERLLTDGSAPDPDYGVDGVSVIDFDPEDFASGQALAAAVDAQGRVVIAGLYFNGSSNGDGADVSQIFIARLQADASDAIFANGFE